MRIIIAGAGIMGVCTAYFLRQYLPKADILVFEQDVSFQKASTHLSAASLRTQFSTPMSIKMSQFGLQEIRRLAIPFMEGGYLYLATQKGEAGLRANHLIQKENSADVRLYARDALALRFPFLNLDEITLGAFGESGEGWFDAAMLHSAYKTALGIKFIPQRLTQLHKGFVTLEGGETAQYDVFINAAGALSALLMPELPVEPRKRTVFVAKPKEIIPHLPLIIDPSGLWLRSEGEFILMGGGETGENDLAAYDDFNPDYHLYEEKLWPSAAKLIPSFENLKFYRAWAGHYDYNRFDQNALMGQMAAYHNAYAITGFSGHGLQHGAAAGRALAELIVFGQYKTLDLSCFSFARVALDKPLTEVNII